MKKYLLTFAILSCTMMHTLAQRSVEPMLTTSWHQSTSFNEECPNNTAAGCGAIAVAQILNYYRILTHGFGHVVYEGVDVDFQNSSIIVLVPILIYYGIKEKL